jgi:signal transduction histidine kinase
VTRLGASVLLGREGHPVGAVATCQDIGSELSARADRARMERFRETFLGVVGHDLRFPLGVIALTASTLVRDEPDEARRRALERIVRSTGRMERMIAQLLDLTRLRVGQGIEVTPAPADLGALAAAVVEQARAAAPGVELCLEVSGDCTLDGDADRLEQVLDNLVGNAVQHGAQTAPVQVRVNGTDPERLRLEVRNGGTVPADALGALFEPFRARGGSRSARAGLGLGLYISRQLVEAHGGALEVRSAAAEGTCFTVLLPRRA